MTRAARCALKMVLVGVCGLACHVAAAQDRGSEQQATPASTQTAPGTLEILLGRGSRQQARGAAAANSSVSSVPAALRPDQQPIAAGPSETSVRGEPNNAARNAPALAASNSDAGSVPTRANALGRDTLATSLAPSDSSASDATAAPPAPQK